MSQQGGGSQITSRLFWRSQGFDTYWQGVNRESVIPKSAMVKGVPLDPI